MENRAVKQTSGLMTARIIICGIDCSSIAPLEYVQKTRQRVSLVALTGSEITLSGVLGPVVFDRLPTWLIITSGGVLKLFPVRPPGFFDESDIKQSPKNHVQHTGNRSGKPLPVCCRPDDFVWNRLQ